MISKQEHLNDLASKLDKLILRAVRAGRTVYMVELKIFKNTRLNCATEYTAHALRQTYNDLCALLGNLDAEMFKNEIEWCTERAKAI